MKDPRTVSPEEKERTIKLGRKIFANLLHSYGILPESLQEFSRNIEFLSRPAPQAAPKPAPARKAHELREAANWRPE